MAGSYAVTVEYVPERRRASAHAPAIVPTPVVEAAPDWHELITIHASDDVIRRWWADPRSGRRNPRRRR